MLEIGTGSGYQTAILAELAERVFSIERIAALAARARKILDALNYYNVAIRVGDGTYGWREEAPYAAIMVTAGAPRVPRILIEQLAVGGRLVIPVGSRYSQALLKLTRLSEDPDDLKQEELGGCRFVDLIGEHGWDEFMTGSPHFRAFLPVHSSPEAHRRSPDRGTASLLLRLLRQGQPGPGRLSSREERGDPLDHRPGVSCQRSGTGGGQ